MARRTQAIIMQAFIDLLSQKSIDKITVTDVIEKANVNRNTFYYYYDNIPSLLEAFFKQERIKFTESSQRSDSLAEEYRRACALFQEKAAEPYQLDEESIGYVTHFYSYAIVGLTMHWIQKKMPPDGLVLPEQIESTFYASVERIIVDCRKYSATHRNV